MNTIQLILLFSLFPLTFGISLNNNNNNVRNFMLKTVIYKKKTIPKLLNGIKNTCKIYYTKSIEVFIDCLNEYDKLSYEDKQIIDFILSTIL